MADLSPNGTSAEPPPLEAEAALEQAHRRIEVLEESLRKHRELALSLFRTVHTIYDSSAWDWAQRLSRIRTRLRPATRYPRAVCTRLLRGLKKLARVLPHKEKKAKLRSINDGYERWIEKNEPGPQELQQQRLTRFARTPRISLLVPVGRPPLLNLRGMLHSVTEQTYPNWELFLVLDNTSDAGLREFLREANRQDPRVRIIPLGDGKGLFDGCNAALASASGEFIGLLDPDDALAPFALSEVVQAINAHPEAQFFYSDEDCLTGVGTRRKHPHFKPDWSPDTLRSHNYIGHLAIFHRDLLEQAGGFRPGYEGDEHYDLILRASERAEAIVHIPKILYHRRKRTAASPIDGNPRQALAEHLERSGVAAEVRDGPRPHTYQVRYTLSRRPLVSIIIPNKDHAEVLARCVASLGKTTYAPYEILIVENRSERPETFACYQRLARQPNVGLLTWKEPFNYSAVNNYGARRAAGEVLLFLNNDVEVINPDWLERMLEHALRPEVGGVGAKLYYPDDTIQHAGSILGVNHAAGHYQRYFPRDSAGYANRLVTVQNLSAVTGACLMTRKEVFEEVGGFDEWFVVTFNDMDLCLKIREKGYRVLWTPFAELYHYECTTRGFDVTPEKKARIQYEMHQFQWKWAKELQRGDPYYSPNLTLEREDCSLRI